MNLLQMVDEHNTIIRSLIENGGVISPEMEEKLSTLDVSLPDKIDSYYHILGKLALEHEYWKEKADALYAVAKGCITAQTFIKERLKFAASSLSVDELKGVDYRFKIQNGKKVLKVDREKLPESYYEEITHKEKVLKELLIYEEINAGKTIEGAELVTTRIIKSYVNKRA